MLAKKRDKAPKRRPTQKGEHLKANFHAVSPCKSFVRLGALVTSRCKWVDVDREPCLSLGTTTTCLAAVAARLVDAPLVDVVAAAEDREEGEEQSREDVEDVPAEVPHADCPELATAPPAKGTVNGRVAQRHPTMPRTPRPGNVPEHTESVEKEKPKG